jgi:Ribonuclease G/E
MAELVECPRCGGTGVVKVEKSETKPSAKQWKLEANIAEFFRSLDLNEAREEKVEKTCPVCHGLGRIRAKPEAEHSA